MAMWTAEIITLPAYVVKTSMLEKTHRRFKKTIDAIDTEKEPGKRWKTSMLRVAKHRLPML